MLKCDNNHAPKGNTQCVRTNNYINNAKIFKNHIKLNIKHYAESVRKIINE